MDLPPPIRVVKDHRLRCSICLAEHQPARDALIGQCPVDKFSISILPDQRGKIDLVPQSGQGSRDVEPHTGNRCLEAEEGIAHRKIIERKTVNGQGRFQIDQSRQEETAHWVLSRPAPAELPFQQVGGKVDHRGPAVRAGARRLAGFQFLQ